MLTEAKLRKKVYDATYKRGSRLYNAGGVLEMEEENQGDRVMVRAKVQGSGRRTYHVALLLDGSEDKILDYDCECPANSSFSGMCKHCVATLLNRSIVRNGWMAFCLFQTVQKRKAGKRPQKQPAIQTWTIF